MLHSKPSLGSSAEEHLPVCGNGMTIILSFVKFFDFIEGRSHLNLVYPDLGIKKALWQDVIAAGAQV